MAEHDVAIRAEGLGKRYRLGELERYRTLRESLARAGGRLGRRLLGQGAERGESQEIWALRDVGFEVRRGEVLGIIGRNGSGKSTLLKLLSRITEPTTGHAVIRGRVGSLLEVGTGFHPELTGRENIFLNGAILGMRRAEIRARFDEIVAFSEVERFLDTPVKRYSSGMRVRLAFAVAAHLDPEILLVDEVLAVGDAAFQSKCLGKMDQVARGGRTILFVSHNLAAIETLCQRCLLLDGGRLQGEGPVQQCVAAYLHGDAPGAHAEFGDDTRRSGSGAAAYRSAAVLDRQGRASSGIGMGEPFAVELEFRCREGSLNQPSFGVEIRTASGQPVTRLTSRETHGSMPAARSGGRVRLDVEDLKLVPGTYYLTLGLSSGGEQADLIENALRLEVAPRAVYPTGRFPPGERGFLVYGLCKWNAAYE